MDEFQDTNIAQLELLHLLSHDSRNIVVVGDNDQAIYRFRGASFGSFKLFLERFTDWKEGQDSTPYRSLADAQLPIDAQHSSRGDASNRHE